MEECWLPNKILEFLQIGKCAYHKIQAIYLIEVNFFFENPSTPYTYTKDTNINNKTKIIFNILKHNNFKNFLTQTKRLHRATHFAHLIILKSLISFRVAIYKLKIKKLILMVYCLVIISSDAIGKTTPKTTLPLPFPIEYKTIFEHDFHQAIEKLAQENWIIYNETDQEVVLIIKRIHANSHYGQDSQINLPPKEIHIAPHQEFSTKDNATMIQIESRNNLSQKIFITDVQFKFNNKSCFLNLESNETGYRIVIQKRQIPAFPQIIPYDDMTPQLLDPNKTIPITNSPKTIPPKNICFSPNNIDAGFINYYNQHIHSLHNTIFPRENINIKKFYSKLNIAYNSFEKNLNPNGKSGSISNVKVPPIIHTLWFTSDEKPRGLPKRYIYWLKKSIEACPKKHGFSHRLWVHNKSKLPKTVKIMESLGVEIHETKELGDFPLKYLYEVQFNNKRYGRASDIFRLVVLNKIGGIYRDTDYRIHQSLLPLIESYNFIAAREPWWTFVSNAFIISSPNHPMIRKAMDIVERNCLFNANPVPEYLLRTPQIVDQGTWDTVFKTGPGVFSPIIDQGFNLKGFTDIILPHSYLLPTTINAFPQSHSISWNESVPLSAYGVHYFEGSWTVKQSTEFGSLG